MLTSSRLRAKGRARRQQELLNQRNGRASTYWGALGLVFAIAIMLFLHGTAAFAVLSGVDAGQDLFVEASGQLIVHRSFIVSVQVAESAGPPDAGDARQSLDAAFREEAKNIADRDGGDATQIEQRLHMSVNRSGTRDLLTRDDAEPGLRALPQAGRAGALLGSLMLLWWFAMLVCQGEGLELDLQRRRHPIWEWLLSHPVNAGAVFLAEMLSPLSANPTYWTAPLFVGIVYGAAQGAEAGFAAAVLIGIPLTLAAACVGKALEIGALLRLPSRSRGAVIGILSWFGYASMLGMFFVATSMPRLAHALLPAVDTAARVPWPWLGLFLGQGDDGRFSFLRGMVTCWLFSAGVVALAVLFSARSVRHGLSGAFDSDRLTSKPRRRARFGREPLFRKEYLWFVRDRSAIVQAVLIPVTVAGFQLFNLRKLLIMAAGSWNLLTGAAIFFGTYFLWILGPKSLASEGSALWIALTWPRGLEGVLKAKAWLWSMIASALVFAVLLAACFFYPQDFWKIALVAAGWFFFARSMAEKSVTLVTVPSESGEAQPIPRGRRWAAQLGMLTFAIGVCTQQWHLAIVGIVYSWITAAAMWENLRARLPYLYDPWSEVLPPPPTLMHAMVSISILIECASVLTALVYAVGGKASLAVAQALGYAICAVVVSIGVSRYLAERDVGPARIWCWRDDDPPAQSLRAWASVYLAADHRETRWLVYGLAGGLLLGVLAHVYVLGIEQIPGSTEQSAPLGCRCSTSPA